MTPEESDALDAGLVEALGVLRAGTDEEHRAALQLVALTALSTPAGAHLWACLLDAATEFDGGPAGFAAMLEQDAPGG